jgi:hypothetical protein
LQKIEQLANKPGFAGIVTLSTIHKAKGPSTIEFLGREVPQKARGAGRDQKTTLFMLRDLLAPGTYFMSIRSMKEHAENDITVEELFAPRLPKLPSVSSTDPTPPPSNRPEELRLQAEFLAKKKAATDLSIEDLGL